MLRLETETGYWLVTHVDHANLAGAFAARWGNALFRAPEPREQVLRGISRHDDGWRDRDAQPQITRQGKPSAFSVELVGKYSAFEEIDLADYLVVRDRAVRMIAEEDPYAAILVSMHTHNLLSERADRSTIAAEQLPLLDSFLVNQEELQRNLLEEISRDSSFTSAQTGENAIRDHFRLLQATDNLSLLACVDYRQPATLLHPLPLNDSGYATVAVEPIGERTFRLDPCPFAETSLTFTFPARHVEGKVFESAKQFQARFANAKPVHLEITVVG
jgi:Protein of unknown function (DUF3891)